MLIHNAGTCNSGSQRSVCMSNSAFTVCPLFFYFFYSVFTVLPLSLGIERVKGVTVIFLNH